MTPRLLSSLILALGLILASLIHGGIYRVTSAGAPPFMWRVNTFTGSIVACHGPNCERAGIAK